MPTQSNWQESDTLNTHCLCFDIAEFITLTTSLEVEPEGCLKGKYKESKRDHLYIDLKNQAWNLSAFVTPQHGKLLKTLHQMFWRFSMFTKAHQLSCWFGVPLLLLFTVQSRHWRRLLPVMHISPVSLPLHVIFQFLFTLIGTPLFLYKPRYTWQSHI